jgi:hypothetical protein
VLYRAALTFPPAGQTNQMGYLDRLRGPFGLAGLPAGPSGPSAGRSRLARDPVGSRSMCPAAPPTMAGRDTGPAARSGPRIGLEF